MNVNYKLGGLTGLGKRAGHVRLNNYSITFIFFTTRQSPTTPAAPTKVVTQSANEQQVPEEPSSTSDIDSTTGNDVAASDKSPLAQQAQPISFPMMFYPPSILQSSPPMFYPLSAPLLGSRFPFVTMVPTPTQHVSVVAPTSVIPVAMGNKQTENSNASRVRSQSSVSSSVGSVCDSPRLDINDVSMDTNETDGACSYAELRQFADEFKAKRIKLGYTQGGVGLSLAEKGFSNFAQSTISRFEQMQLSPRNAAAIKKILEKWLMEVENPHLKLTRPADKLNCRKRKRRIVFSSASKRFLEDMFCCNPKPDRHTIEIVAKELSLLPEEVRIWFCNKRQKERNMQKSEDPSFLASSSSPASSIDGEVSSPRSNFSIEELSKSSCSSPASSDVNDNGNSVCSPQYQLLNFANFSTGLKPVASPVSNQ